MRIPSLLVLSLVFISAFVSSAPVEKIADAEEIVEVAKRDQEQILYGNQQNEPRIKKKSDPAMPVVPEDNVDKQGFIQAVPANVEHFIPETKEADDEEQTSVGTGEEQDAESADAYVPPITQQIPETKEQTDADSSEPEAEDSVEEELKGIMADSSAQEEMPGAGEEVPSEAEAELENTEVPEESEEESVEFPESKEEVEETEMVPTEPEGDNPLMDLYYYMLENEKAREDPDPRDSYYDDLNNLYPYRRRRSSRQTHAVTEGDMTHNNLQRIKRIKRDLFDDNEGYYYPYEEEAYEPEPSEEDLYELYRADPKYEDEVATLLDMYQQAPEEPTYEQYVPVEEVYPELYEELEEEQEEPQYVPSKRQTLSSLPGIKKRYFYPFNREPQTHWGAFIPEQKRDYDQTYRRLLALASALSEESPYYQEYRKK